MTVILRRTESRAIIESCDDHTHWWPCDHFPDQAAVDAFAALPGSVSGARVAEIMGERINTVKITMDVVEGDLPFPSTKIRVDIPVNADFDVPIADILELLADGLEVRAQSDGAPAERPLRLSHLWGLEVRERISAAEVRHERLLEGDK